MYADMRNIKATEQNAALNKIVKKENAKSLFSKFFGK
jgi:hypothetical protein